MALWSRPPSRKTFVGLVTARQPGVRLRMLTVDLPVLGLLGGHVRVLNYGQCCTRMLLARSARMKIPVGAASLLWEFG
jgi:hypothetical protein